MNAKLYYQLVDTLKKIEESGGDPKKLTDHALRQLRRRVYSYDRTEGNHLRDRNGESRR